jgi:peptidoglycan hydrolase-like protein with peptidoglycan-binding domain
VSQLQNRLKALGFYNADETGYYSRLTEQAVSDFQRSRGLSINGIAGPTTLAALQNNSPGNSTTTILRRESRGTAVSQLQNRLKALGFFQANVTGYYGSLTEEAVRKFQRSRGLSVNGIAGPTTLAALQDNSPSNRPAYVATQRPLRYGDSGSAVTQLQNRLKALGFYKYEVTSYYGRLTEDAVSNFQRSRGLSVNGIAGPTTLAALQGVSPGRNSTAVAALQR